MGGSEGLSEGLSLRPLSEGQRVGGLRCAERLRGAVSPGPSPAPSPAAPSAPPCPHPRAPGRSAC
eukprot:1180502-Prorocentrum_minimum.AAC.8